MNLGAADPQANNLPDGGPCSKSLCVSDRIKNLEIHRFMVTNLSRQVNAASIVDSPGLLGLGRFL